MINQTEQTLFRLSNLDAQQTRISYQMSTGKKLQDGSDDSVLYAREIYVDDKIRVHEGLKTQIERTTAQNAVSDSSVGEIKKLLEFVKTELIKANTSTTSDEGLKAIAVSISGVKENLFDLANTQVEGEYLFSGSDSSVQAFSKNSDGSISYNGDNKLRKVIVDEGSYRERGINGYDMMMYSSSIATKGETLTFSSEDQIFDEDGKEWGMRSFATTGNTFSFVSSHPIIDDQGNTWTLNASIPQLEDGIGNSIPAVNTGGIYYEAVVPNNLVNLAVNQLRQINENGDFYGLPILTTSGPSSQRSVTVPNTDGTKFEAKTNIFDVLDKIINSLNKVDNLGNPISNDIAKAGISKGLDDISDAFDGVNVAHAELGGRNKIFEISLEKVSSKLTQYNILSQEIGAADLSKVAMEAKALELTYTALYSTISKTNQLSLVNFLN